MKRTSVKVAIIGASGYSGEELVRLLLSHPHAELTAVTSRQYAGQTIAQIFPKFASHPKSKTVRFSEPNAGLLATQAEIVFLALPHGVAAEYAVPLMKKRGGGSIVNMSSLMGLRGYPCLRHARPEPRRAGKTALIIVQSACTRIHSLA